METTNRQVVLKNRPTGMIAEDTTAVVESLTPRTVNQMATR